MDIIVLLGISLGLCFDSFAVSISGGLASCGVKIGRSLRFAVILGLCQGIFPLIGWGVGRMVHELHFIGEFDHWIAFILLTLIGVKMIAETSSGKSGEDVPCNVFGLKRSFILGIATSIDALITGFAISMVEIMIVRGPQYINMLIAALIIAVITFAASIAGLVIGQSAGRKLNIGSKATIAGGVILIVIGIRILLEHLFEI